MKKQEFGGIPSFEGLRPLYGERCCRRVGRDGEERRTQPRGYYYYYY